MDKNTQIILANATRGENWEDRPKANDDVAALLKEFDKRLPSNKTEEFDSPNNDAEKPCR